MKEKIIKLLRLPEKIQCDKRMHFMVGSVFTSLAMCIIPQLYIIVMLAVALAWGIEFSQRIFAWGDYDNMDAIAVVAGSFVVILPTVVAYYV